MARYTVGMQRLLALAAAALVAGCALRGKAPGENEAGRRTISEGYSILYYAVSEQRWLDKVLLVKPKSDEATHVIGRISRHAGEVRTKLEDLAKRYPAIHLEPPPPGEIEQRARQSQYKQELKEMYLAAGDDFERRLFLSQYGVLDQLRHLAGVMADAETDANRRAFWNAERTEYEAEYREVAAALARTSCRTRKAARR